VVRAEGLDPGQHPNIVTVHDIGEDAGNPYILRKHMGGGDVAGLIAGAEDHRLSAHLAAPHHAASGPELGHRALPACAGGRHPSAAGEGARPTARKRHLVSLNSMPDVLS